MTRQNKSSERNQEYRVDECRGPCVVTSSYIVTPSQFPVGREGESHRHRKTEVVQSRSLETWISLTRATQKKIVSRFIRKEFPEWKEYRCTEVAWCLGQKFQKDVHELQVQSHHEEFPSHQARKGNWRIGSKQWEKQIPLLQTHKWSFSCCPNLDKSGSTSAVPRCSNLDESGFTSAGSFVISSTQEIEKTDEVGVDNCEDSLSEDNLEDSFHSLTPIKDLRQAKMSRCR